MQIELLRLLLRPNKVWGGRADEGVDRVSGVACIKNRRKHDFGFDTKSTNHHQASLNSNCSFIRILFTPPLDLAS